MTTWEARVEGAICRLERDSASPIRRVPLDLIASAVLAEIAVAGDLSWWQRLAARLWPRWFHDHLLDRALLAVVRRNTPQLQPVAPAGG